MATQASHVQLLMYMMYQTGASYYRSTAVSATCRLVEATG